MNFSQLIANELSVQATQVIAAIDLLDKGATVPFIARYRKETTGGLSDTQLRHIEERLQYLRELAERQQSILNSIREQERLTPDLEKSILLADNKSALEDLYLPYKPKRRTKAQIAKEAGLEPLATQLLNNSTITPLTLAEQFINQEKNIVSAEDALDGARYILMELFSEHANLLAELRTYIWEHGKIKSEVVKGKEVEGSKFHDYFLYQEPIKKIPSHRALALFRGQREEILTISLILDEFHIQYCQQRICQQFNIQHQKRAADAWLIETVAWTWRVRLQIKFELESMTRLRESAEEEAIRVFASNLQHLLMAAPAGSRITLGLDPGLRTGVKFVVVDGTGKLLAHDVIFPHAPKNDWHNSIAMLAKICAHYHVELVSIGNGTASRETDKLIAELKKMHSELKLVSVMVSEAGASVYSASETAAEEFPSLDVSYRGAVSIARRLQDPLAELVKIDPKSIGVGQYQHDVNQAKLSRTLHSVMEDCVNAVGVDVNTASIPLLTCIAGLNETVAKNIVAYRDANGAFLNRQELKKVPRFGEKAFEQAAGFLRILNGENPLDASAVHPEAYAVVNRIVQKQQKNISEIVGNTPLLRMLNPAHYIDEKFGIPTITDILRELDKPGRDPRPEFKTAMFKENIAQLEDLQIGMIMEGVVTNVANFGAFVDIGVHQDGLVHISMLANQFVKDPHQIVKVGDIVKVKVISIDIARKRIQLSMRLSDPTVGHTENSKSTSRREKIISEPTTLGNALLTALKSQK